MLQNLSQKLKTLPQKPGVYLFKNAAGEVLYIGKAKNLKNRVRSYFFRPVRNQLPKSATPSPMCEQISNGVKSQTHSPRIALMLKQVSKIDYVIVSSEIESLILENNFIKQYRPRFNIRLRDDKNYQFIKIDYSTQIPQIYPVRRISTPSSSSPYQGGEKRGGKYFGPYTSASSVKQTLKLLNRIFHLCRNKKVGSRPCFAYHLGRCDGICLGKVNLSNYRETLTQIEKFLNHSQGEILRELKSQMFEAAKLHQFEKAASLRDKIFALQKIWEKQKVVFTKPFAHDYFGLYFAGNNAVVNLFIIRGGRLIHQEFFELEHIQDQTSEQILEAFLKQYYSTASNIPKEIYCRYFLPEQTAIEKWLNLKIIVPRKGKKIELIKLVEENAKDYFEKNFAQAESILANLKKLLSLPKLPRRIEAYDISNIQGFLPVGSMVVFENAQPKKSDYRKFKINLKQTPNDVAMMKEVISRRLKHGSTSPLPSPGLGRVAEGRERSQTWPTPDLLIIDGGKGQLNAALEILTTYNLQLTTIGLAKRLEEIFIPGKKESIRLPQNSPTLQLLQRIRDEAHRFAISFYRGRHRKYETASRLDEIPGIGPKTKKLLLQKFGTLSAIRQASFETLSQVVDKNLTQKIKELL